MKLLSTFLTVASFGSILAQSAYKDYGIEWGVENNDWCIIKKGRCDKSNLDNQCFSFPEYPCCKGNNVVLETIEGKWGVEDQHWCGIKEASTSTSSSSSSSYIYDPNVQYKEAPQNYLNPCPQAGKIIKEKYNGINGANALNVYLPYGYDEKKQYNIFYFMHGGGDNEDKVFSTNDVRLGNYLDHMTMNGELEPLIVVTPTFTKTTAQTFYKEFHESVVPFVESKYSTYAKSTSAQDIKASRMHRGYGGFSMGGVSTWALFENCLDIVAYYMPLSGDSWEKDTNAEKAKSLADAVKKFGIQKDEFFIFSATGSSDIAYPNLNPQIEEMKKLDTFIFTSDFSKGNCYYMVADSKTHDWKFIREYVYDALPTFFHE
ncbi:carbohydrate esterase family 1 protein [Piromyces sp. E2]|nr:carbohydrate esterase family 1 protein [Piromyces sp. E2]|eukprot:OUM60573.1 carbohydrate esterase family 1 protein [Piromyces sp. E2]